MAKRSSTGSPRGAGRLTAEARADPTWLLAAEVHSAALRLLRLLRREDRASEVGPAQLSALSVLVFAGPQRLGELARIEDVRPPTVTGIVRGLEAAGLARRRPDVEDQRSTVVEATPAGRRVLLAGRDRRVAALAGRITDQGWSLADRAAVARAAKLLARLVTDGVSKRFERAERSR